MDILAISGSLKATSTNSALLRAAAALAPATMSFSFYDRQIGELPHFQPDLDEEGSIPPPAVADFRAQLARADGLLISCPEYAHGVPGAFKNALDWVVSSSEVTGKPTVLLMAGPGGATQAWAALTPTLRVMGFDLVFEASLVVARRHFDGEGRLLDADLAAEVTRALTGLAAAVQNRAR
ncbi:MAG: NADPH-dependent FMN reductase [Candidatus Binatia bacterium]